MEEKDLKILKGFIEFWRTQEIAPIVCEPNIRAMENILQELKRLQEENEELRRGQQALMKNRI